MSLTATYNGDLSRVQLSADNLGASATYAVVERSLNATLWTEVRGGLQVPVLAEEAQIDDYEFWADVQNSYRVTSYDDSDVQQAQFTTTITPSLDGEVWLKSIKYPALNRAVQVLNWSPVSRQTRTTLNTVAGRSVPVAVTDQSDSATFTLQVVTDDLLDSTADGQAQAAVWDIIATVGGVMFVHVPSSQPVPGGYVTLGTVSTARVVSVGDPPLVMNLPCTVVAPPGADVVGTTLTWGTVMRLYGSWTALYAAHASWRSLLATVADPDDLVVL